MQIGDGIALAAIVLDQAAGDLSGLVGGVVEQLNVEFFPGIVYPADRLQQAVDNVLLIKNGQLNRNPGEFLEFLDRLLLAVLLPVIEIYEGVAMHSVGSQQNQNHEVGDQQGQIETVDLVQALEGGIEKMLAEVLRKAAFGNEQGKSLDWKRHAGERPAILFTTA